MTPARPIAARSHDPPIRSTGRARAVRRRPRRGLLERRRVDRSALDPGAQRRQRQPGGLGGRLGPGASGGSTAASSPGASPAGSAAAGTCPTAQPDPLPAGQKRTVTVETPKGPITIEIDGALSPIAAGNFVALAGCGYYDGVVFHRLVPGFVIQGGDGEFGRVGADGKLPGEAQGMVGTGGPGYTIKDEPVTAEYGRGVVAMARTSAPDSVGSQFFIVLDDAARPALASANTYQIIGKVTAGMEAVDAIAAMPNCGRRRTTPRSIRSR